MVRKNMNYPNITWQRFGAFNENPAKAFEDMTRLIFVHKFLKDYDTPHSNPNNPGVEVEPILEPEHEDGSKRRKTSFQSKYFENRVGYPKIYESAKKAVDHYAGGLDRIYLFCNLAVDTNAKKYIETQTILSDAGIELKVISGDELIDLAKQYIDTYWYFIDHVNIGDCAYCSRVPCAVWDNESGEDYLPINESHRVQTINRELLEKLVSEKIDICRNYILTLDLAELRKELDKIFSYQLNGINGSEQLYFYRALNDIHDGKYTTDDNELSGIEYRNEVAWLDEFYKNPAEISTYVFAKHIPEVQVLILDKMFSEQLWDEIINLCSEIGEDAESGIADTLKLYYGLSLFNTRQAEQAFGVLNGLYLRLRQDKFLLFATFADIQRKLLNFRTGIFEQKEEMADLLDRLDALQNEKQYQKNKILIAMMRMEAEFQLGRSDKTYIDKAIAEYATYDEKIKADSTVRYWYGFCLEANGNAEGAAEIFSELDWKSEEAVAIKYILNQLYLGNAALALQIYKETDESIRSAQLYSLYLTALYKEKAESYAETLSDAINKYSENLEDLISIGFGVEDKKTLSESVIPALEPLLNETAVEGLCLQKKTELLIILSESRNIELIERILYYIKDINILNAQLAYSIYNALFEYSNTEYRTESDASTRIRRLELTERIADRFLEAGLLQKEFLQIRYLCAAAGRKNCSMLKFARELFDITQEPGLARTIIGILYERNDSEQSHYEPYINMLKKSDDPADSLSVASAMVKLGHETEAEFYAYKALYYLNGKDDYEIYKGYFGFHIQTMGNYNAESEIKVVGGKTIVLLEECNPVSGKVPERITYCLDPESELSDSENHSLGVKHLRSTDQLFSKLKGSGLKQIIKIGNVSYKVIQIQSRSDAAAKYVCSKISANPEKIDSSLMVLSAEDPQEMIEKIRSITDQTEQTEAILNLYHFEKSSLGIPLDTIANHDPDRYLQVIDTMLNTKDQAFYTGLPSVELKSGRTYIPDISTVVLLGLLNLLDILLDIKENVVIPESYKAFAQERYANILSLTANSPGVMCNIGGSLTIIPHDSNHVESWERILEFCNGCTACAVTDDERINFKIGDNLNGEQVQALIQFMPVHLDAMIVAAREEMTFVCDDLFFRKLASAGRIRNINFVSLLEAHVNDDFVVPIIMKLSKTNYLYVPIYSRTDQEAVELYENLMDGELKRKHNGWYLRARAAALRKIFKSTESDE